MYRSHAIRSSRLAQLVERKTLNLVVVGSSPTVGVPFCFSAGRQNRVRGPTIRYVFAPVAQLAARRSHNPKVASSILAGSKTFFFVVVILVIYLIFFFLSRLRSARPRHLKRATAFGWMAERSKALV